MQNEQRLAQRNSDSVSADETHPTIGSMGLSLPAESENFTIPAIGKLKLQHAVIDDWLPSYCHRRRHQHLAWHAVVYTRGSGTCLIGSKAIHVRAPFLVLTGPEQRHAFSRLTGEDTVYSELTFAPETTSGALSRWSELLSAWSGAPCSIRDAGPISQIGAELLRGLAVRSIEAMRGTDGEILTQSILAELLSTVYRLRIVDQPSQFLSDEFAQPGKYIEQHAEQPLDVIELAKLTGCSVKDLGRIFRERYGVSPRRYRKKVLMDRAADLLAKSDASIAAIAQRLGFSDWRYFSRCFSRHFGQSPSRWRIMN